VQARRGGDHEIAKPRDRLPKAVPAMSSSPAGLAAGQLAMLDPAGQDPAEAPRDLLDALARVPDPRDPRGVRYALVPVLAAAVCATLAGARSYAAIAERAADAPARVRAGLGLPAGAVPDLATT
jgi:hypothetical protein